MKIHRSRFFINSTCPLSAAGSVVITIVFSLPFDRMRYLRDLAFLAGRARHDGDVDLEAFARKADLVRRVDDRLQVGLVGGVDDGRDRQGHHRGQADEQRA